MCRIHEVRCFNESEGLKLIANPVKDSVISQLLHLLRPIVLHQEVASFNNINSLLSKKFKNSGFRAKLKHIRQVFEKGELSLYMSISVNNVSIFDDEKLKLWLNGEEYHQDIDKSEKWKEFVALINTENTHAYVMNQLHGKVLGAIKLEELVDLIIDV